MIVAGNERWRRIGRIAAELAGCYGALLLVDDLLTGGTGFAGLHPNPLWLPVMVMALAYGTGPALVAATIASILWLAHADMSGTGRDYLDHLFHLSLPPLLWFVTAVGVGEVTMLRTQRYVRLDRRAETARRNVARLTEAFHRLEHINRALQVQVAIDPCSGGHVVAVASRLATADAAERPAVLTELIALGTRTGDFTCYRRTDGETRAWLRGPAAAGQAETLSDTLMTLVEQRDAPVHVGHPADRAALAGHGVVAIPLPHPDTGRVIGCVVLHSVPFAALNAHALAEMAEVGRWLAPLAIERAPAPARRRERVVA